MTQFSSKYIVALEFEYLFDSNCEPHPPIVPVAKCNCRWAAKHNNEKYKDETSMYPTVANGDVCKFCSHSIFWDTSTTGKKKDYKVSARGTEEYRKFETKRRTTVGDWHKTSKLGG